MGAIAGRAAVMAAVNESVQQENLTAARIASPNPLSVTAGTAALNYLLAGRAAFYPQLNEAGRTLAGRINAFAEAEHLPVQMMCAGSMFRLVFGGAKEKRGEKISGQGDASYRTAQAAMNVLMLSRGVLTLTSQRGLLSTAHTSSDIENVLTAFMDSLRDVRADGLLGRKND